MWHVFLDLDGTLTDPKDGIVRSIQYALRKLGVEVPTEAKLLKFIGPPLRDSFLKLTGSENLIEEAVRFYRERFAEVGLFENVVYPGVKHLLQRITAQGWTPYVVTVKPTVYALRIVEHFGLHGYFHAVYGSELDGRFSRKEEIIASIFEVESVQRNTVVMVGDRLHDVQAANAHGIPTIGVTYGYGSPEELTAAGARWLCDTPESVYEVLHGYFGSTSD
jgi:phosphoglycolate phosphatase